MVLESGIMGLLSVDGSDTKIEDNKFIKHSRFFLKNNKDFSLPKDMNQSFKVAYINNFIRNCWGEIKKKMLCCWLLLHKHLKSKSKNFFFQYHVYPNF